ncbi:uncharacterized protein UV8b_02220 [Ustilaginoidea virens]|uniref:Uncharacterized protein n=1 Tax=Ustilaginoidea virens TaxID=1159556 RepID=A0A8E5HM89_USTVR|nr:uncharacterized protein UV8b_02220 [Ustilaginoidea virens]QUC17979.1 hypothetical protein UV8b_02220 [Ustilaginoidea virens]
MNSLKVPEGGWLLAGSSSPDSVLPPQAFVLNLSDDVVEQMIQSVRVGNNLELKLGKSPTLHYGSKSYQIPLPEEEVPFDLYLTKPFESTRRAERLPHAGSLFSRPRLSRPAPKKVPKEVKEGDARKKATAPSKSSTPSALDSDMENLQNSLAAHDAARDRARVVEKLPVGGKGRNKLLSSISSTPKSLPTSPSLNAARSPNSISQITATQQMIERKKEQRFTLVHELAVADRTTKYLENKWAGKEEDFRPTLEKMANYSPDTQTWSMRQSSWRELDVWKYDYDDQDDRRLAIDRAIRQYDKLRLSSSEAEWQLLLPKEERGKGKCLSRLQASIAKGPPQQAPKAKPQKTDDSHGSKDDAESAEGDKRKPGGEAMSRAGSNSTSIPAKTKKPTAQEAQAKRLLSNSKAKSTALKTSPSKTKAPAKNDKRVLSAPIIENSDSSGDEGPMMKSRPAPPAKAKDTVIVNTKSSASREKAKKPPVKRPREESDSSSSSGTPLSKRIKPKQPLPAAPPKSRPQPAKSSHVESAPSRVASSSFRGRTASNTSPTKSSPLASSPPTNASDLDEDTTPPAPIAPQKRKMDSDIKSRIAKRRAVESVPAEVMNKAHKFKTFYQKYEALHYEISALDNPPHEKLADLLDMRGRLEHMKREIYKQYSPSRE